MASIDTLVVTRTRNRPAFLKRAAESIAAQRYDRLAWVVVNDGGERDPVDAVLRTLPASLSCEAIHLAENVGMEAAGNAGMASLLGDGASFAALHDDDDRWSPEFLSRMTAILAADADLAGAVCDWEEVEERISEGEISVQGEGTAMTPGPLTLPRMAVRNRFPPISLLFRKQAWKAAGGFSETLPVLGDWDFNLRLLLQGDLATCPHRLAYQHVRPQASGDAANSVTAGQELHKAMRTRLINDYVRREIASGKPGLGTLLAQADILEDGLARTSLKSRLRRVLGLGGRSGD